MSKRMLIDAAQEDEQRVVVLEGDTLLEADFHSAAKAQIKGNIYLARVTRVEPSLQAAFVDFGKGKHGFLPFSEIHPDYFQIPVADREALLEDVQTALSRRQPAVEVSQEDEAAEGAKDAQDQDEAELDLNQETVQETAKPKKRGRKKAEAAQEATQEEDTQSQAGDEKPKRQRKTASKTTAAPEREGEVAETTDDTAAETDTKPKAKAKSPRKRSPKKAEADGEISPKEAEATQTSQTEASQADGGEDETAAQAEEPKKKPRGRPRKTSLAAIDTEVVFEDTAKDAAQADGGEPSQDLDATEEAATNKSRNRGRRRPATRGSGNDRRSNARPRRRDEDTDDLSDVDFEARSMTRAILAKKYKIQEVIKRNQVILVQAAKEERGDKGAALTTYLSLPGRYCVLMPNTHRGGGVSRRIADGADRKRLKAVLDELELAPSMSLIVRTAGAERTKQEIKRDFAYLTRTWDEIRETTLNSFAPALVYEEANLIKRAIRDVYEGDTQEVLVAGEAAHKAAKAFMKTLTPSHAARVKAYKEETPLFQSYGVEGMLESLNRPTVRLPSGGYLVFNQTEALVAVDVNSGKATKERNIEETALRTNLEAAKETARQLRLRDLAGLVVIDFIDMDENRNVTAVERALKEALKPDRARIQVGRISQFGLMELSRQRLRPSVAEATMTTCPTCHGTGYVKSTAGNARGIVRQLEQALSQGDVDAVTLFAGADLALSLANDQRTNLNRLETTFDIEIKIAIEAELGPTHFRCVLEKQGRHEAFGSDPNAPSEPKGRGRNRGGRGGRHERDRNPDRNSTRETSVEAPVEQDESTSTASGIEDQSADGDEEGERRKRRRGRRGGRRRGKKDEMLNETSQETATKPSTESGTAPGQEDGEAPALKDAPQTDLDLAEAPQPDLCPAENTASAPAEKPAKGRRRRAAAKPKAADLEGSDTAPAADTAKQTAPSPEPQEAPKPVLEDTPPSTEPKRRGWWSRVSGS